MAVIVRTDDRLELRAPFHPNLPYRCKSLGGRWRGPDVGWVFDVSQEDAVRAVCLELFALDGREESLRDVVEVQVTVDETAITRRVFERIGPISLVGREIVVPLKGRDVARPGRGVRFLKGRPLCRQGVETVWLSIPNGSVFVMRDVPGSRPKRAAGRT